MKYSQYKKWKSQFYISGFGGFEGFWVFWGLFLVFCLFVYFCGGSFWFVCFFWGGVRLLFNVILRNITENENAPWSSLCTVLFLSYSFLPSFSKIRQVHSSKICLSFITYKQWKHIPGTVTVFIMDNSYCIQLELRRCSPEWLWDPDHINLSMNFGNGKIKSHLSQTVYQYAVTANVRKYHSLFKQ